jgi:hypothetical protein
MRDNYLLGNSFIRQLSSKKVGMLRLIVLISCYLGLTLCLFDESNSRPHYVSSIYEYFVNMSHGRHRNLRSNIIQQNNRFNDPKDSVNFVFFGDWGYLGENQTLVASSMSQWTQDNGGKFVIALGDNFYGKLFIIG